MSAFSTSVLAFCLLCNPPQSSLALSQDESCCANLKKPNWSAGKPASLRAVYIIYCICFFYINWAFCLWYKEIKITFIIITQSRGTGTSPWNHLFSFWHLHQLSLCKPPLNRHFSLMYAAQIIQSIISMIMCSCSSVYCVHRTPCVVLSLPRYLCILLLCKLSGFSLSLNRCCSTNNSSSLNFNGSNSESLHRAGILSYEVIYQPNIHWFQLHKCEDLSLSSALYQYNKAIQYI